ncbi:MAG: ROK family protein, partial [Candidatus Saccharicenans sp.]
MKKTEGIKKGKKAFLGAIDIGGTKIASAIFTFDGRPLFKSRVTVARAGGRSVLDQVLSLYFQLEAESQKRKGKLVAIGLGVPGVVNPENGQVWAPNIKGWKNFQLLKYLKKEINCLLSVVSDRTAYILGEAWKGAARGRRNVIYLAVGTGIGAGIMAEGKVVHGAGDLAGA